MPRTLHPICLITSPQLSQKLADRDEPQMPIPRNNRCQSNYHCTGDLPGFMSVLLINVMRVAVAVDSD